MSDLNKVYSADLFEHIPAHARIYFVGIGGISMSGLAELAQAAGFTVAGSDLNYSQRLAYLAKRGVKIYPQHDSDNVDDFKPDLLVYTAALLDHNPELERAAQLKLPSVDRASFLGWLNRRFEQVINIAGTHGKTTTTAMCSLILIEAGQDPTVHLGAELEQFDSTVRIGQAGQLMVSEACEYKFSFLKFFSTTAAVLNIDYDHVDCFANLEEVIDAFVDFILLVASEGNLVIPAFDANVVRMLEKAKERLASTNKSLPHLIWFGHSDDRNKFLQQSPDFSWQNLVFSNDTARFDVLHQGKLYGYFSLKIPGQHAVANAVAAIAMSHLHGSNAKAAAKALEDFQGAEGRFTQTGFYKGARVIADYAHHPAAAVVTIEAARNLKHEHIWVVFQPLTFNRTAKLFDDYVKALKDSQMVLLSEIYSDRESLRDYISSADIAKEINKQGGNAIFCKDFAEIKDRIDQVVGENDLILVLGPENIRSFADELTGRKHGTHGQAKYSEDKG